MKIRITVDIPETEVAKEMEAQGVTREEFENQARSMFELLSSEEFAPGASATIEILPNDAP